MRAKNQNSLTVVCAYEGIVGSIFISQAFLLNYGKWLTSGWLVYILNGTVSILLAISLWKHHRTGWFLATYWCIQRVVTTFILLLHLFLVSIIVPQTEPSFITVLSCILHIVGSILVLWYLFRKQTRNDFQVSEYKLHWIIFWCFLLAYTFTMFPAIIRCYRPN